MQVSDLTWLLFRFRWFGLILLPFVSFSADGANVVVETSVAIFTYCREPKEQESVTNIQGTIGSGPKRTKRKFDMWNNPLLTSEFAHGRPIDMSIQFTLCWTPLLVLFGWWFGKPMHLLFGEWLAFHYQDPSCGLGWTYLRPMTSV